jgi:FMN-dependent NADH-azoreductase
MNILQINSSVRGDQSESTRVSDAIVASLRAANPAARLTVRDLGVTPAPVLDGAALAARFTPAEQRTPEQAARAAIDLALIAELQGADVIVIGAPMYNFSISAQLKGWFDAVLLAGVTFRYTATGPEGLVTGKKVYVASARGGVYPQDADPQIPQLGMLLNFIGLTDATYVYSSAQAMGPEAAANGQAEADAAVAALA